MRSVPTQTGKIEQAATAGAHRRENVPRPDNALGTWPAELKVDLKRSQTGPQHDIRMCFVAYWTPLFHSVRPNG